MAYKAIESLKTVTNFLKISQIVNELDNFTNPKKTDKDQKLTTSSGRNKLKTVEKKKPLGKHATEQP